MSIRAQQIIYKKPPWHKLIDLQGHQGVLAEWGDFPSALLQITPQLAQAIPCDRNGGCYLNIVRHGDDKLIGICTAEPRRCDRRTLSKAETIVYRLNTLELFRKIAEATYCHFQHEAVSGQPHLWKIGHLNPQADYRFPVYVFLGGTASGLDKAVNLLAAQSSHPFLLISTLGTLAGHAALEAAQRSRSKIIGLDDVLDTDGGGAIIAKNTIATLIAGWTDALVPKSQKPGSEYRFPTPAGATWEHFVFEFTAKEVLNVTYGTVQERLEPEHLGMKNQNTGKPTNQWTLLQALAMAGGSLSWQDEGAKDTVKKQKQELMNKLKSTFQLTTDPLPWDQKEKCYRCKFTIRAAQNVLSQA